MRRIPGERPVPQLRRRAPQWSGITSDEELVALAQRDQREAFGVLYDRYLPRVYGYCYRLLEEREAAEDANTDVFMRALSALPTYHAGSFRSWLFTIAHNVITDALRRRRPTVSLDAATHLIYHAMFEDAISYKRSRPSSRTSRAAARQSPSKGRHPRR